jgi:hypothetical protein
MGVRLCRGGSVMLAAGAVALAYADRHPVPAG